MIDLILCVVLYWFFLFLYNQMTVFYLLISGRGQALCSSGLQTHAVHAIGDGPAFTQGVLRVGGLGACGPDCYFLEAWRVVLFLAQRCVVAVGGAAGGHGGRPRACAQVCIGAHTRSDRKSTRLNSSH